MRKHLLVLLFNAMALPLAVAEDPAPVVTDSGMVFQSLEQGEGVVPGPRDRVRVHYRGTFSDGREFDSSYARGKPIDFGLDQVIACWTEGLQRMRVGSKARLICPPEIAYGRRGAGRVIPPDATLMFEVELLDVLR